MKPNNPPNDEYQRPFIIELALDLFPAVLLFMIAVVVLYGYADTWPPAVNIISTSMEPNMKVGDEVLIQGLSVTDVHTAMESQLTDYKTFGSYGDVIVYRPMGDAHAIPVIHRAIYWVNESEPMWPHGPLAPHSGYITLGDNNGGKYDQLQNSGICPLEPVKEEWVLGVAKFRVPYIGYLRSLIPV